MKDLAPFFEARSYAIIGASTKLNTPGYVCAERFIAGFSGEIYLINPRGGELFDRTLLTSPLELPMGEVDVCVIIVSAKYAVQAMIDSVARGVKNFILISGGFAEAGGEGIEYQRRVVELVEEHDLKVIGPNCVGVFDPAHGIDTVFLPKDKLERPGAGPISLFSQSGALVAAIMNELCNAHMADSVARILSFGNACDVNELDALDYFKRDEQTELIWAYLEGLKEGPSFFRLARELSQVKPIVAIKSNRTSAGAHASASHSASLAADDGVCDYLMKLHGVVRADKWTDLFDCGRALLHQPLPKGRNVTVVTDGGGMGVMCCDAIDMAGLKLTTLDDSTKTKFHTVFPPYYICGNPLDLTGSASVDDYVKAMQLAVEDPNTEAIVLILLTCVPNIDPHEFVEKIAGAFGADSPNRPDIPILACCMGGNQDHIIFDGLNQRGIPVFATEVACANTMALMAERAEFLAREAAIKEAGVVAVTPDRDPAIEAIIDGAKADGRHVMLESEAAEIFRLMGLTLGESRFATTVEEAVAAFHDLGDRKVVMKLVSPQVIHKTDEGAVFLHIQTEERVIEVATHLFEKFKDRDTRGILINVMCPSGTECLVGCNVDPVFGPLVLCGIGGTYVEILKDATFGMCPVHIEDARMMVADLKNQRILDGYRGDPPVDREGLARSVELISQLAAAYPEIAEIDVNPIIFYEGGYAAVDARILLHH